MRQVLNRTAGNPRDTARAFSLGLALAFGPLPGTHLMCGLILSRALRLNFAVIAAGIFVHNPWTMIPIHLLGIITGDLLLYQRLHSLESFREFAWHDLNMMTVFSPTFWQQNGGYLVDILIPYLVGHIVLAIVTALIGYFAVLKYMTRRLAKKPEVEHTA